jgi:hypothetical protein
MTGRYRTVAMLLCGALTVALASPAFAGITDVVLRVEASNSTAGDGVFEVEFADGTYDPGTQTFNWSQFTPVPILNTQGTDVVAMLDNATLQLRDAYTSPQVNIGFAVTAGAADTSFTFTSGLVTFPTIADAYSEGRASAGFGVTDLTGDGATLQSTGAPGTGMLQAYYNGDPDTGTLFSQLVYQAVAGPFGSGGGSQNDPPFGFRDIAGDVDDMTSELAFWLTAGDRGNGTTNWELIPEPGTLLGLLLVGLALRRRR